MKRNGVFREVRAKDGQGVAGFEPTLRKASGSAPDAIGELAVS